MVQRNAGLLVRKTEPEMLTACGRQTGSPLLATPELLASPHGFSICLCVGAPAGAGCRGTTKMDGFLGRFAQGVFTPETTVILTAAFDKAWGEVVSSNAPWAQPDYAETGRTILAKHIIAAAKAGETDTGALIEGALLHLSRQKLTRTPPAATAE